MLLPERDRRELGSNTHSDGAPLSSAAEQSEDSAAKENLCYGVGAHRLMRDKRWHHPSRVAVNTSPTEEQK